MRLNDLNELIDRLVAIREEYGEKITVVNHFLHHFITSLEVLPILPDGSEGILVITWEGDEEFMEDYKNAVNPSRLPPGVQE